MSIRDKKTEMQKQLESLGFNSPKSDVKKDVKKITVTTKPHSPAECSKLNIQLSTQEKVTLSIKWKLNKYHGIDYKELDQKSNRYLSNLLNKLNYNLKENIRVKNELTNKYKISQQLLDPHSNNDLYTLLAYLNKKKMKGKSVSSFAFKNGKLTRINLAVKNKNEPKQTAVNKTGPHLQKNSIKKDSCDYIRLTSQSTLSHSLLSPVKTNIIVEAFTDSNRTQLNTNQDYETELVVGLDFGTANTKVVVQEQGSGNAWAIPFTNQTENPYLLPSCVYFNGSYYSLFGEEFEKHGNLKLPLILKDYNNNNLINIIAFITLVIRHAREWFLIHAADSFQEFTFEWLYNMGLPAANNDDGELIKIYRKIFIIAVKLSLLEEQLTKTLIATYLNKIENTDIKSDPLFASLQTCPEIQAQLEGYIRSDRWDSQRIKFMMVDVGGGTVDASIINVTYDEVGDPRFNCLKTKVDSLGIKMLHYKRLNWIQLSANNSLFNLDELIKNLDKAKAHIDQIDIIPAKVNEYVDHTKWLHEYSIDNDFYNDFFNLINVEIISKVKKYIDIEAKQWNHLQFIFCGGGSLHPLYKAITKWDKLDILALSKPKKLIAPKITDSEYHRLSVAYGLSFSDLGSFINPSEIDPMLDPDNPEDPQSTYRDRYIEQP
jgi:hypothetical protein